MTAVILAAGQGTRMKSSLPKAMLTLAGETLISRQVRQLRALAVKHIIVVLGDKAQEIRSHIEKYGVRFCYNENYRHTDNLHSFKIGVQKVADECLMLHCDLIFTDALLVKVFNTPGDIVLPVDKSSFDREAMKIRLENGIVRDLSKDIPLNLASAESLPLMKFSQSALAVLKKEMDVLALSDKKSYLESAIIHIIKNAGIQPIIVDVTGYKWAEIDTPEDYDSAKTKFA